FAGSLRLRTGWVVAAVLLLAGSHWIGNLLYMGSLDHLFGLAYLPACLALAGGPASLNWRVAGPAGIFLGAVALGFAPGLLLVRGTTGVVWGWRVLREGCPYRVALGHAGWTLLTALTFLNLELRVVTWEARLQLAVARAPSGGYRPGGRSLSGMLGKDA